MKLLVCRSCGYIDALKRHARTCNCNSQSGGQYNEDGDTATVWGDSVFLLGLHNQRVRTAVHGRRLTGLDGDGVLWPYPMDNGKITRLAAAP